MERWPYGHVNDSGNRNMGLRKCRYANTELTYTKKRGAVTDMGKVEEKWQELLAQEQYLLPLQSRSSAGSLSWGTGTRPVQN